jgi:peptidase E
MVQVVCTGKGAAMAIPKILSQVQLFANTKTPRVLYLGTPSFDRNDIFNIQTKGFQNADCPITKMDLSEVPISRSTDTEVIYPTKEEMREQVDKADVVMVSGGNTLYAMQRWEELGMAEILKEAATKDEGPVFCGGSAGAICWFEYGNSDSMNPMTFLNPDLPLSEEKKKAWDYIRIDGLNIVKALCVPHYDVLQHNGLQRAKASEGMVKDMADYPCIGIDEEAAFVVDGDIVKVIQGGDGAKVYKKMFNFKTRELEVLVMEEKHGPYSLTDLGLV